MSGTLPAARGVAQQPPRIHRISMPTSSKTKSAAACSPKSSATSTACRTNSNTSTTPAMSNTSPPRSPTAPSPTTTPTSSGSTSAKSPARGNNSLPPAEHRRSLEAPHQPAHLLRQPLRPRPDGPRHRAAVDRQRRPQPVVRLQHLGPVHLRIVRPDVARDAADGRQDSACTTRASRSTANRPKPRNSSLR